MEAIVLAGGLGTRLKSVVNDIPKPMAPIQNKPFLEYVLTYLQKNGVSKVIISVSYQWQKIKDYFGDRFESIILEYSVEKTPLGTGGGIKKALQFIESNQYFIINGDTFFDVNLSDLTLNSHNDLLLCLKKMYKFDRYGWSHYWVKNVYLIRQHNG